MRSDSVLLTVGDYQKEEFLECFGEKKSLP